jgi:hypothetical protein
VEIMFYLFARQLLWYKKPPTGSDPYHQNHLLDFDGAWSC